MRWARVMLAVVVVLVAAPAWADFKAGKEAYLRGDYATALKEFRVLAEQGHAEAQNNLGVMYDKGRGVPQDYAEAIRWFRLAATQGYALAQYKLGVMYQDGTGVVQNYKQGYMWFNLAAAQGDEDALTLRDLLAEKMTPAQLADARRLTREWQLK